MKKRSLIVLSLMMIAVIAVVSLSACVSKARGDYGEVDPFEDLGKPTAQAKVQLNYNDNMTATDLLEIGYKNYYLMDYVVTVNYGFNATKPSSGGMTLNGQYIDGYKIRKGAYDPNDTLSADYYHLSKSGGSIKSTWEEGLIVDGKISHRIMKDGSNLSFSSEYALVKVDSLDDADFKITNYSEDYENPLDAHNAYNSEVCNDPTKILMYDVFNMSTLEFERDTVTENGDISYDASKGVYSFNIKFNPEKSTTKYKRVITANLKKTSNNAGKVNFTEVSLGVEMWSNGLIKQIKVNEKYNFSMGVSMLNDYWANVYFSWDEARSGYVMNDYKDAFTSNFGIIRNNNEYDNVGAKASMSFGGKMAAIIVPIAVVVIVAIVLAVVLVKKKKAKLVEKEQAKKETIIEEESGTDALDVENNDNTSSLDNE